MKNGEIICNPLSNLSESYCALLNGGESYVDGMKFQINTNGGGEHENPSTTLKITSNGVLNVSNSIFKGVDNVNGSISNIYVDENCVLNGKDCNFEIISPNGMSSNVFSKGNIYLENCDLQCYANHTANDAGTYYATMSRAIYSLIGNVTLKNCIIYGTHSGLTIRNGELYIDGGTYDGYSHGGIYLGNANQKSYIYNASINDVALRGEGMYDDGVAGTNNAAMYIGGANFMQVYVDNCEFYGKIQPIVIKYHATSSHDNHLYISNSRMNLDYTRSGIRNDGANYVTFGINNNFDYRDLENNRNYENTNENYFIR
jgi:hypothetical protein